MNGRKLIVRGGDEDRVDIGAADGRLPIGGRRGAARGGGQLHGARRCKIAANRHAPGRKRGGALASDQSAADDGHAHSCFRGQNALYRRNGHARAVTPWKEIMKIHSTTRITGAILATLLCGVSALARDHSSLNGTWTLVPAKSDFAGHPVVQTGTVTINDHQGIITVSRNFVYKGTTETFYYSDMTDADRGATIRTGKDLKSKTRWDHDVLKVTTTQSGAITLESYTLAAAGAMMVSVVRRAHKPTPVDTSDPLEVIARAVALSAELATTITPGFQALVFKASRGIEDIYELK